MKLNIQDIGTYGKTIYSLAPTSDQKLLYVGSKNINIEIFSLQENKLLGKVIIVKISL